MLVFFFCFLFRPACAPIYANQHHSQLSGLHHQSPWSSVGSGTNASHHFNSSSASLKSSREVDPATGMRKEKRQYKKRKHKLQQKDKTASLAVSSGTSAGGYGTTHSLHHPHHHAGNNPIPSHKHLISNTKTYLYFGDQSRVPPIVPSQNSRHHHHQVANSMMIPGSGIEPMMSSDEDDFNGNNAHGSESEDEGVYSFKRNRNCNYHKVKNHCCNQFWRFNANFQFSLQPVSDGFGNWPWVGKDENGKADKKYRFTLTSIRVPRFVFMISLKFQQIK